MGSGEQIRLCHGCGTTRGRIEDLGLPQAITLCGDCLLQALRNWMDDGPTPLTVSEAERSAAPEMDLRMLRRRLDTARDDTA